MKNLGMVTNTETHYPIADIDRKLAITVALPKFLFALLITGISIFLFHIGGLSYITGFLAVYL